MRLASMALILILNLIFSACTGPGPQATVTEPVAAVTPQVAGDSSFANLLVRTNNDLEDLALEFRVSIPSAAVDAAAIELTEDEPVTQAAVEAKLNAALAALAPLHSDRDEDQAAGDAMIAALRTDLQDVLAILPRLAPDQLRLAGEAGERSAAVAASKTEDSNAKPLPPVGDANKP